MIKFTKQSLGWGLIGLVVGGLLMVTVRAATVSSHNVHYHANFALYINGRREQFKSFTYYEEIQACTSQASQDPRTRVHLHDNVNDVIHVHDAAVTWGDFFANLGFTLGDKVLATRNRVYVDGDHGTKLNFILNGQPVTNLADKVIGSEDRLLIDYGQTKPAVLAQRFKAVASTAHTYNQQNDPASCSGSHKLTLADRLKAGLGFNIAN